MLTLSTSRHSQVVTTPPSPLINYQEQSIIIQLTFVIIEKLSSHDLVATLNQLFRLRAQS